MKCLLRRKVLSVASLCESVAIAPSANRIVNGIKDYIRLVIVLVIYLE